MVRVSWGSIARIGSSYSLSRRFTRAAVSLRFSIVELKFSSPRISSSEPLRSWSKERMTAAIGPATKEMTSENGSMRPGPVSAMGDHATRGPPSGRGPGHVSEVAYASSGSHEHTSWRSPAAASMRETGGKYFDTRSDRRG